MKLAIAALVAVLTIARSWPALAWDPFTTDPTDPDATVPAADPAPFVIPDGLYVVTDVYTGDVVTSTGSTTTYATTTTHETPGTWARVIDTVGTGEGGALDGASMNTRARLADGQLVAGTYYEDFVLTADGFVSVNIVFFQDDSVTTVPVATPEPPAPAPTAAPAAPRAAPAASPPAAWSPSPASAPAPTAAPPPAVGPGPTVAPVVPRRPVEQVATAGLALGETATVLRSIEVLRGRRVALWPRAFLNGAAVPVRSWRLVSGYADLVDPASGGGSVPCEATWLTLAPPGSAWTLRFEVTSDAVPGRVLAATIDVVVRSPALER